MSYAYSQELWVAAHTAALAVLIGGTGTPKVRIRDAGDVLLTEAVINDATAAVATNGDITLPIATQEDSAPATGTASYAELVDGDDAVHATLDCEQGTSPVSGACVVNILEITTGAPVNVATVTIPAGFTIA